MPVTKQDALRALQLLVELRNGSDDAAAAHYDALIDVMQSKLFVALLELQDFYFDKVVHRAATRERQSVASSKSRASYGELEWEDDYDFGGQPGNNDGRPQSVQRAASAQLVEVRMEEVELTAGSRGLGMSISGGVDRPFVPEDTSIFITNITPGGAADQTSILRAGDSIVSINGVSMEGKTHADAVVLLKSGPSLHLVVLHGALAASRSKMRMQTSTASLINVHQETIDLHRQEGKGLGFTIAGGVGSPHVAGDDGIFVSKIIAQSVAERDGRLTVGDRLLSVQGQSCHGLSHEQAVSLLRSPASPIVLVVEHGGFDKAANELGSSLGLKQAAGPQLTRTGTLKAFGQLKHGEQGQHDSPFDQPDGGALRKVTLTKGAYGFGFNLVGPTDLAVQDPNEAKGIFISRVMPQGAAAESGQVFEGDEIVTLNGHELTTAPYRKALALIRSIPDGVMQLQLRSNPKVYNVYKERMAALQANEVETKQSLTAYNSKDGLCVRALYEYNPAQDMTLGSKERKRKLLSVQLHDVYLVPQVSTGDWWEAENLNTGDKGLIPSRSLAETKVQTGKQLDGNGTEAQQEAVLGSQGKRKRTFSFRFARRLTFRRKRRSGSASVSDDGSNNGRQVYEAVELVQVDPEQPRPLLVLGPTKDYVTDKLIDEFPAQFGSCVPHTTREARPGEVEGEDYHFVTMSSMTQAIERGEFIEAGQYRSHLYGTSVHAVQEVIRAKLTCVLDVSVSAIPKLHAKGLFPIVVYLKPESVASLRMQNSHFSEDTAHEVFALAQKVEADYKHLFTQTIVNSDLNVTYERVLETLRRQSREPFWAPRKDASVIP